MRRIALTLALFVFSVLVPAQAAAAPHWCEEDPLFLVNGNLVDITTTFLSDHVQSVNGPIHFELQVPENTLLAAVVSIEGDVPVRGYVSRVLPKSSLLSFGVPVVLRVWMDADAPFETYTKITGLTKWGRQLTLTSTVVGWSTKVQTIKFTLPLF